MDQPSQNTLAPPSGFWSSSTWLSRWEEVIINGRPQDSPPPIKCGAYELGLGDQAFITSQNDGKKQFLNSNNDHVQIPPGQFGLLISDEMISIPRDCIGFISIRAGKKFCGLVNVSGFHVDPGYEGRLKFSVYNAGSRDVFLAYKKPIFLLWLAHLDHPQEPDQLYPPRNDNSLNEITDEDIMKIHGVIASPGDLNRRLSDVERFVSMSKTIFTTLLIALFVTIIGGLAVNVVWKKVDTPTQEVGDKQTERR